MRSNAFPLQNLVQYLRMDIKMSVGVGKVTGIWTFYTVIDFFYELSIFYVYQVRNECRSLQSVIFAVL